MSGETRRARRRGPPGRRREGDAERERPGHRRDEVDARGGVRERVGVRIIDWSGKAGAM